MLRIGMEPLPVGYQETLPDPTYTLLAVGVIVPPAIRIATGPVVTIGVRVAADVVSFVVEPIRFPFVWSHLAHPPS